MLYEQNNSVAWMYLYAVEEGVSWKRIRDREPQAGGARAVHASLKSFNGSEVNASILALNAAKSALATEVYTSFSTSERFFQRFRISFCIWPLLIELVVSSNFMRAFSALRKRRNEDAGRLGLHCQVRNPHDEKKNKKHSNEKIQNTEESVNAVVCPLQGKKKSS